MTDQSSNAGEISRHLQRQRLDQANGLPSAYSAPGGTRTVGGDDQAPFFKSPPFPSKNTMWATPESFRLTVDDNYGNLRVLDVGPFRTLTSWITFTASADDAQLSLIGAAIKDGADPSDPAEDDIYPVGVVGTGVTIVTLTGTPFAPSQAASRTILGSEFRTPQLLNNQVIRFTLEWDVEPYNAFTLYMRDLVGFEDAGRVNIDYTFSM